MCGYWRSRPLAGRPTTRSSLALAGLSMRVESLRASQLAFDNMEARPVKGTTPWTRYDVVLDVPTDAATIMFGFCREGQGRVWADDFALEVVGLDVPTTDLELEPGVLESPWPGTTGQPMNLGFEE